VAMYALGVIVAHADGTSASAFLLGWGLVGVSAIQLMTHFVNEYYDTGRDALVTNRTLLSGGSGVLPAGTLARHYAAVGAVVCGSIGVAVTLTIGRSSGPDGSVGVFPVTGVTLVYVIAFVIGYGYSAPPLRLMTRGMGELVAASAVAFLTPMAGYAVTAGRLSASVAWLGLPLLAMSLAFMITVELPDYDVDRRTDKRNWVVRLGRDRAGSLHNGLVILSYLLLAFVAAMGRLPDRVAALLWWTLPLAVWQVSSVWLCVRQGWRQFGLLAAGGLALIGLYGLLAILGYWLWSVR
jgi:1,4-dihydroxy-2-naphthoate octaprenyltransferase